MNALSEADVRAELDKVMAVFGYGADDARWRPGETAVDALIREHAEARAAAVRLCRARDVAEENAAKAEFDRDGWRTAWAHAVSEQEALVQRHVRLCRLIREQRHAREALGQTEWSDELAQIEADITDLMAGAK